MRVCVCWPNISGYMTACWRALAARGVDLQVIAYSPESKPASAAPFDGSLMQGIPHRLLTQAERMDQKLVRELVVANRPDVAVISGWSIRAYRQLLDAPELKCVRFVLTMDTPWRGDLRQRLARLALRGLVRRTSAVFVPGERGWQYAKRLGFPDCQIHRGLYGIDYAKFSSAALTRSGGGLDWPRRFLFTGRYAHVKGVDTLIRAYSAYRSTVDKPWQLSCCGSGPLAARIDDCEGVTNMGFVQPPDQPGVYAGAGVFILPSRYDPWPLAVVEACAAGLPVICSTACGSAVELLRPYYNGLFVPPDDWHSLAQSMAWMHHHPEVLAQFGHHSNQLAAAYSAEVWANRWEAVLANLRHG